MIQRLRTLLSVFYAYMLEYRAELVLWALSNSLPFILMGAWHRAASQGALPFTPVEFARYFLSVFLVRQLTVVWVIWEFEADLVKGRLSHFLLAPMNPVWRYVAAHVSERLARGPFTVLLVGFFFLLYPDSFWIPGVKAGLLAMLFIALAFVLRFLIQYTLAMLCFWTERATSADTLWFILYMFLSGAIAPLELFPPVIARVALYTPFPYLVWVPVRLLMGGDDVDVPRALLVMLGWSLLFFVLYRVLWKRGLAQNTAMGA